jgi:hypothetical protein
VWQYFEDIFIGSFQYKKNGVEVINTINDINSAQTHPINYPKYLGIDLEIQHFPVFLMDIHLIILG